MVISYVDAYTVIKKQLGDFGVAPGTCVMQSGPTLNASYVRDSARLQELLHHLCVAGQTGKMYTHSAPDACIHVHIRAGGEEANDCSEVAFPHRIKELKRNIIGHPTSPPGEGVVQNVEK